MTNVFARRKPSSPRNLLSISDPRFMGYLGLDSASGMPVNAYTALTVSALWRGLMTVSSAIAGMPLATMREWGATRSRVSSWLDDPGQAVGYKPFSWKQTSVLHFILGGDSFQRHLYNGLGMIAGLEPINPNAVNVYWDDSRPGGKRYEVSLMRDGKMCRETYDKSTMTQVMGPTLDGLRGLGLIDVARTSVGGALAADMASARTFRHGPMVAAVAVPQDELQEGDAEKVQAIIDDRVGGVENAGRVVVLERKYDLKPFGMTNKDAQFLESREFSIYEAARWLGVHPVFLMDPKAVSTWGTGVEILQRGLGRFTLPQYTDPFQEAMTALLPNKSWAEFNFKALERGSPADEIDLIIKQVDGGLLTINQALALVNQPSIGPAGDVLRLHGEPLNPEVGEPVSPTSAIPAPDVAPTNAQLHEMLMGDSR